MKAAANRRAANQARRASNRQGHQEVRAARRLIRQGDAGVPTDRAGRRRLLRDVRRGPGWWQQAHAISTGLPSEHMSLLQVIGAARSGRPPQAMVRNAQRRGIPTNDRSYGDLIDAIGRDQSLRSKIRRRFGI